MDLFKSIFIVRKKKVIFLLNYGDYVEEFEVDKYFSGKMKNDIEDTDRTDILNMYINEFELGGKITSLYKEAMDIISNGEEGIEDVIKRIIELFDYDKYLNFLYEAGYQAPDGLVDKVSEKKVRNGRVTYEQTYSKSEYMELLPFIGLIKAIGPIYAMDAKYDPYKYPPDLDLLIIGDSILNFNIMPKPINKILAFIDSHISSFRTEDDILALADSKNISTESVPIMIFGNIVMKRLFIDTIYKYPPDTYTIKNMYSAVTSGTSIDYNKDSTTRFKTLAISPDTGDKEAWGESNRQTSPLTLNKPEEYNFIASDIDACAKDMDIKDVELVYEIYEHLKPLRTKLRYGYHTLSTFSLELLKDVMELSLTITALPYLTRDNVTKLLALAYVYIYEAGLPDLACYTCLIPDYEGDIRITGTINQIPKSILPELNAIYPYVYEIKTDKHNIKEELYHINLINERVANFKSEQYNFLLPERIKPNGTPAIVYKTIKEDICKLLIHVEKHRHIIKMREESL